jgi:Domain of unknown function (DUF4124)
MKTVWIASLAIAASTSAFAQTTIYKHVDDGGHITYSNKPMKGAIVMELDPIMVMPATPVATPMAQKAANLVERSDARADAKPAVANLAPVKTSLASIEPQVQKRRDGDRRKILEQELRQEEDSLTSAHDALVQEQQNPMLIAAVRVAQQAAEPTPSQMVEFRANIDKASGRIRGLQATVAEHEKNIEALNKELGALKP